MLWQNRRFTPDPDTGFTIERRDFVPGKDRDEMIKLVGVDGGTAWWDYNIDKIRTLCIGSMPTDPKDRHPETRTFPTQKDRAMMDKIVPDSVPPGHRIASWWEGDPMGADAGTRVVTLCVGVIKDANAPVHVGGDGLDGKQEAELLTLAGRLGVKDASGKPLKRGMNLGAMVAYIRAHQLKAKESKLVAASA